MPEKLVISNFLIIKKADIDIKSINVLIGPQANGKSIIAKLLYLFKSFAHTFYGGVRKNLSKRDFDKSFLEGFEERFPRYTWEGSSFTISYSIQELDIKIFGKKKANGTTSLGLSYSEDIKSLFAGKKKTYQRKLADTIKEKKGLGFIRGVPEQQILHEFVINPLQDGDYGRLFSGSVFIPATRSFFANLQKNIFTFLASNLDVDPYLKEFGSLYESAKRVYKDTFFSKKIASMGVVKAIESIVGGDYEYHDEQDWIVTKGNKINLANASSGQQEALPMLVALSVWPTIKKSEKGSMCFIEEPEAHLFPTSQGTIISVLSTLHSKLGTNFFITTHSPYIISAINNFILAQDLIAKNKITEKSFGEIQGFGAPIKYEDVSAYTIKNGEVVSIMDAEYRLVGATMLDEVSEHFESVMNQLLSLDTYE